PALSALSLHDALPICDGAAPLVTPVWYSYEPGGDVVFVFSAASEKVRLIEAAGRASLCAQTETVPYRYVAVEGPAVVGGPDAAADRKSTRLNSSHLVI